MILCFLVKLHSMLTSFELSLDNFPDDIDS